MRGYYDESGISMGRHIPQTVPHRIVGGGPVNRPGPTMYSDGRITRKWHLTPWTKRNLLDVALSEDGTDASGTAWTDVLNNLVSQAGNVLTARSTKGGVVSVPRPLPGQVVPSPTTAGAFGLTSTQLLIGGVVALGGLFLLMRRR